MFDRLEIIVRGGAGGDGAMSFRREKFVPRGGPDGGDGGRGGGVIIMADPSITTLGRFKTKRLYKAGVGKHGSGQKKHGKGGSDLILSVPVGTVVMDKNPADGDVLIVDMEKPGQQAVIARGGKGGFGNPHYVSSTNQAPQVAQKGEEGEEKSIILEMRLIADVGIIGYPNAGKSTLLSAASAARPEIASYPFTTRQPVLGVVEVGRETFVLAEIPGLIEGAHLGRGLGHDFLRHVVRTKALVHLIDGSSATLVEDMTRVNIELTLFDPALARRSQLAVVNKIDLPQVRSRVGEIEEAFGEAGIAVYFVSAETGEGVPEVMAGTLAMLRAAEKMRQEGGERVPKRVFRPQPQATGCRVSKEGDTFVVNAPKMERIVARVYLDNSEVRWQLKRQLIRLGINRALEKAGIKPGDKVRCGDFEWEW